MSLLAAFFTALSFVSGTSSRSTFLNHPEAHMLLLFLLTTAVFVGLVVILFFDFIHQELVENAVGVIVVVERTNAHFFQ